MTTYTIKVKNLAEEVIGEFDVFRNLQFGKRINNYGTCSFDVPVSGNKTDNLIALRIYTVWIYRNDVLIWAGEQATREGKLDDKGDNWVTLHCFDWIEQLNTRYTAEEVIFIATDAGEIAWSMIETSQAKTNGDFGFTEGVIEPTMDRDRTYNNQNIMEAIINLANVINGFDFEINNSKVFNVYEHIGVDRTSTIILE